MGPLDGLRVAVLGLGTFGLLFAHAVRTAGARTVVGFDRVDRSAVATAFGVDEYVPSTTERWARLLDGNAPARREHPARRGHRGHRHQTATVCDALAAVALGGRVFCFGVPDDPVYPIPMQLLFRKRASLSGGIVTERRRCQAAALVYHRRFPDLHQRSHPYRRPAGGPEQAR